MALYQQRLYQSNDGAPRRSPYWVRHAVTGNFTADSTIKFAAPFKGTFANISDVFLRAGVSGADGTDPLFVDLDVLINDVSIFTTKPQIDDAAADNVNTLAAGTGLTVGVLAAAALLAFNKGDEITITLDITRTTPETEIADLSAIVGLTEDSDFDHDASTNKT